MSQYPPQPSQPSSYGQPPPQPPYGQPPYGQGPLPYGGGVAPRRPTSVTVLAIIGIVLAVLGLLGGVCGTLPLFREPGPGATRNPVIEAMRANPTYMKFAIVSTVLGVLLTIYLLVACISALNLKRWARKGMILYAWLAILNAVVGLIVNAVLLLPILAPMLESTNPAERGGAYGGIGGGLCAGLVGVVYPIFVIAFMNKPRVVAAFEESGPTPVAPY